MQNRVLQHVGAGTVARGKRERRLRTIGPLRIGSLALALVAVAALSLAGVGMVTGRPGERAGWVLRMVALLAFGGAVALNVAAH